MSDTKRIDALEKRVTELEKLVNQLRGNDKDSDQSDNGNKGIEPDTSFGIGIS